MANLCIIQTYQSFFKKWSERHRARAAGVEQHRDLSGGGGDQDDEAGQELGGVAEKQNLKELGDVTSGMASTVIHIFLQSIFDSFADPASR